MSKDYKLAGRCHRCFLFINLEDLKPNYGGRVLCIMCLSEMEVIDAAIIGYITDDSINPDPKKNIRVFRCKECEEWIRVKNKLQVTWIYNRDGNVVDYFCKKCGGDLKKPVKLLDYLIEFILQDEAQKKFNKFREEVSF